ncbi:MAG: exodeoxyribonuclease VII small subunit [Ruminococcus sp.]|nr:exodeoxyribonuclease VII small subunit [Ruminococcus sp.]
MSTVNNTDKFEGMDYETALTKLTELISRLERSDGTFLELMEVYKEAFEYYTYCTAYLNTAADKIKDLNIRMAELLRTIEEG